MIAKLDRQNEKRGWRWCMRKYNCGHKCGTAVQQTVHHAEDHSTMVYAVESSIYYSSYISAKPALCSGFKSTHMLTQSTPAPSSLHGKQNIQFTRITLSNPTDTLQKTASHCQLGNPGSMAASLQQEIGNIVTSLRL